MSTRTLPAELGQQIEAHRPIPILTDWLLLLGISLPLPVIFATTPPGPLVGLAVCAVLLPAFGAVSAEWFFLRHELYEHGVVFRSIPGFAVYVIPHYTINPRTFEIGGRRLHSGTVHEAVDRRFRQCPVVKPTIRFDGLDPEFARALAKGKLDWQSAGFEPLGIKGSTDVVQRVQNRWMATYRNPEEHLQALDRAVVSSQIRQPYYRERLDFPPAE